MSYTNWLRSQIERLEEEIRKSPVFDSTLPATPEQLGELRAKSVLRTYMKQQLLRRKTAGSAKPLAPLTDDELDTQELLIVRGA
jgi:hypothetical protein